MSHSSCHLACRQNNKERKLQWPMYTYTQSYTYIGARQQDGVYLMYRKNTIADTVLCAYPSTLSPPKPVDRRDRHTLVDKTPDSEFWGSPHLEFYSRLKQHTCFSSDVGFFVRAHGRIFTNGVFLRRTPPTGCCCPKSKLEAGALSGRPLSVLLFLLNCCD